MPEMSGASGAGTDPARGLCVPARKGSGLGGRLVHTGVLVTRLTGPCSVSWESVSTIKASAVSTSPSQMRSVLLRFLGRLMGPGVLMVELERKNGCDYKKRSLVDRTLLENPFHNTHMCATCGRTCGTAGGNIVF